MGNMIKLRNVSEQPLVINCGERMLHLVPGAAAVLSPTECDRAEVRGLLASGLAAGTPLAGRPGAAAPEGAKTETPPKKAKEK